MSTVHTIIFAKAPQAGFAKTRLIPALGAQGAADLARQMLFSTLHAALEAEAGTVELCVTPEISDAAWQGIAIPEGIVISTQGAGDLGARMARASQRALLQGRPVLLTGTDCVEMSASLLRGAAHALNTHDAIIHGTLDGGYALLGFKQFSASLFDGMPWSTDAVASTTLSRIGQLGWSVKVGRVLHDVDEPQDLGYLAEMSCSVERV